MHTQRFSLFFLFFPEKVLDKFDLLTIIYAYLTFFVLPTVFRCLNMLCLDSQRQKKKKEEQEKG